MIKIIFKNDLSREIHRRQREYIILQNFEESGISQRQRKDTTLQSFEEGARGNIGVVL